MAQVPKLKFRAGKPTNTMRFVAQVFLDIALEIQQWMVFNNRIASGEAVNSMEIDVFRTTITLSTVEHTKYALQGRGPGKRPPVQNIIDWITIKPLQVPAGMNIIQFGWAIATNIAKFGTKPPHLTDDDLNVIYLESYQKFEGRIANVMAKSTLADLDKIFSKNSKTFKKA